MKTQHRQPAAAAGAEAQPAPPLSADPLRATDGTEVRCTGKLLFIITDEGLWEVKCTSYKCGAQDGVVVFHRFDPLTGELVKTMKYRDAKLLFDERQKEKAK